MTEINAITAERKFEHEGIPAIWLTIVTPVISGGRKHAALRMNAFYGHIADTVEKHVERKLLRSAADDLNDALENGKPFEPYRVKLTFETVGDEKMLTVRRRFYTRTHNGIEHERVLSEMWNKRLGLPDKLSVEVADYSSSSEMTETS